MNWNANISQCLRMKDGRKYTFHHGKVMKTWCIIIYNKFYLTLGFFRVTRRRVTSLAMLNMTNNRRYVSV